MGAVPPVASGRTCSGVEGVAGPVAPHVDETVLGSVVGDVASVPGVGLACGTGAGTVLAAGPSAVTAAVDTEATEGVGSGVVFSRGGVGLLAVSATGWAVDGWVVGPCVDVLSAWGLVGSVGRAVGSVGPAVGRVGPEVGSVGLTVGSEGLAVGSEGPVVGSAGPAVEWRGVCSVGLCESRVLPALAVVAAAVCVLVASIVLGAVVGNALWLGAWVWGVLRAAVDARGGRVDAGGGCVDPGGGRVDVGVGTLESVRLAGPVAAAEAPTSLPGVLPAVTAGELWLAPKVSLADVTGEGVVTASEVLFKMLSVVPLVVLFVTKSA